MNHAFLWDRGVLTDLMTLGGNNSEAWLANEAGEVVGRADPSTDSTNHHAFLWSHGVKKDLGTPNGLACSTAVGINARHQVVGDSGVCLVGGNGWLWEDGSIVDLNTLVPPDTHVHVAGAVAINDRGEIVAEGLPGDGSSHVVVLIPCDDDHPGVEGCDYSMVDATEVANNAAASQSSQAFLQTTNSLAPTINPSQNWFRFRQRYRMLGLRPAFRH
jgi:probable HAF family extracellular repeat protein